MEIDNSGWHPYNYEQCIRIRRYILKCQKFLEHREEEEKEKILVLTFYFVSNFPKFFDASH